VIKETTFKAWGHENIKSTHKTTLMTTTETHLTKRGDCIVAVNADKGLRDLPEDMKLMAMSSQSIITMVLKIGQLVFTVKGRGDPNLTYNHPTDIVARKSEYTCSRTLMVRANKAACDIEPSFIALLRNREQDIEITIKIEL
jgi:hypothetical protein